MKIKKKKLKKHKLIYKKNKKIKKTYKLKKILIKN